MIVMVAASSNGLLHYLAGRYPLKVGWMMSPPTKFFEPRPWMPYAIDNGKYSAWAAGQKWDEAGFIALLDRCRLSSYRPDWIVVPDEIADREGTLESWKRHEEKLRKYGRLAFVAQDGMTPDDVPESADLVFVGGTTKWKWRNAALFCQTFERVHIGRVNNIDKVEYCEEIGAESVDGSGFFREGENDIRSIQLQEFLAGRRRYTEQRRLFA